MSLEWFIAQRLFQSQRRGFLSFITAFTVLGITIGTAALIITLSILDGFEKEIKEKAIGFTAHIQTVGFSNKSLSNYKESLQKIKTMLPEVKEVSPFVAREALIRANETVDGIFLKGIDPTNDISLVRGTIVEGNYFTTSASHTSEIIIGRRLANKLNVRIGDKIIVFGLPMESSRMYQPRAKQFRLAGIYESGMAEYDDIYTYVHLADAQKLFQLPFDAVSGYDILVKDVNNVEQVARQVNELLGYPHHSRTVFETYRNLFAWVDLQKKFSPIILALIIIVAIVNIIGTILMFILEKVEAIGILRTMGMSRRRLGRVFMLQGLTIASIGIFFGNILAFALCWLQFNYKILSLPSEVYYMTHVPMVLQWQNFVFVTLIAFVLCFLTTLIPSRSSTKLDPIQALRFG